MNQTGLFYNSNQESSSQDMLEDYIVHLNFRDDVIFEPEYDRREDFFIQVNPELFQKNYSERPEFIRKLF